MDAPIQHLQYTLSLRRYLQNIGRGAINSTHVDWEGQLTTLELYNARLLGSTSPAVEGSLVQLFQVITKRYERGAIIITTNHPFQRLATNVRRRRHHDNRSTRSSSASRTTGRH
jgi:hypothetical protein